MIRALSDAGAMHVLDLFSAAAGGWSLGMHRAGFRTLAACEVVPWRRALYSENNPGVKVYDDVRSLTASRLLDDFGYLPAVIVGSPPCQDISSANTRGKGVEGERSGLYFEAVRLVGECRPRWFAFENSANLRTRGADRIIAALADIGYTCWPFVVGADDIGANHERKRSWLIGCDVEQLTDADRDKIWQPVLSGRPEPEAAVAGNVALHPTRLGHEGWRPWGHGPNGDRAASVAAGDAADASQIRHAARPGNVEGQGREADGNEPADSVPRDAARNTPDPTQARQAHGCMVPGLRQAEIADDGCCARRSDDRPGDGQMAICAPDRGGAVGSRADWSLDDLARHIRLDDGLPGWVAGTRIAVGGPKGTSAASLIVEAFGDAVLPQIPEAIGRAILRVEAALSAVTERRAAA